MVSEKGHCGPTKPSWFVQSKPQFTNSCPPAKACVLPGNEVSLDRGGQCAGQVGTAQLLSLPLGREMGSGPTPLSPSPQGQRRGPLWQRPASKPHSPGKHALNQNVWVSFLHKPRRKGHAFSQAHKATPLPSFLQFGYLTQPWRTCRVHPTHLRAGHYLPGKLEQARPGVHPRPCTDMLARCGPQCWPVWVVTAAPAASRVCRFAVGTGVIGAARRWCRHAPPTRLLQRSAPPHSPPPPEPVSRG